MTSADPVSGLLVIDKPSGPTSHDIVDEVRRLFGIRKVGHGGTLDPPATGVLLVGLGKATRLMDFLKNLPKVYRAEVVFGVTTSTQDSTGEVEREAPCSFGPGDLASAAQGFLGEIEQVPPMVSAVRVRGRRLHEAARRGEEVERKPRRVRIHRIETSGFDPSAYRAGLEVECSSGTYIRTLAADLGDRLGCGAHLASLRREAVGSFTTEEALTIDQIASLTPGERREAVKPPAEAMRDFPKVSVDGEEADAVAHGQPLSPRPASRSGELPVMSSRLEGEVPPHLAGMTAGVPVAVLDAEGRLIAVYRRARGGLKPAAVLEAR